MHPSSSHLHPGTSSEVGYGGTVLLNCSSSCPEAGAHGGLETSLSKEWVGRGPGWLSIRLYNITEPLSDIFCYFSCFGERKMATFRVLAYGKRPLGPGANPFCPVQSPSIT
uniref:Intercellular adhesion molecule N-terminal domain-containing protein n=1 Tax=Accipiter nisus TaxID=211598 RepID=A0A8B9S037_9AVES